MQADVLAYSGKMRVGNGEFWKAFMMLSFVMIECLFSEVLIGLLVFW